MKKGVVILLLIIGLACLFFQHKVGGVYGVYLKTISIVLIMFSVYKISSNIGSKEEKDSGNFKF